MDQEMTLSEAFEQGYIRVRKDAWIRPEEYLRIASPGADKRGPWGRLYSPMNAVLGQDNPFSVLLIGDEADDWVPYRGALDEEDK